MTLKMKCTTCAGHGDALLYRGPKVLEDTKTCPDCTDGEIDMPEPAMLLEICERLPELREPCPCFGGEYTKGLSALDGINHALDLGVCRACYKANRHLGDCGNCHGANSVPPSVDVNDKLIAALKARGWAVYYYTSAGFLIYKEPAGYLLCPSLPAATVLALRTMEAE